MKRVALLLLLGACIVPAASAQDHGQVGVYADYFRLRATDTNFGGLGGRLAVGGRWLQWEGEINYDFDQVFTEGFTDTSTGTGTVTFVRSDLRVLHGLFGPKLQTGGAIRAFVTLKGGFINFRFDPRPATFNTFASSVEDLRAKDVSGVLYPGGGLEGHIGPVGLRLDVGDEMYFNNGAHHNFRLAFGPIIRF